MNYYKRVEQLAVPGISKFLICIIPEDPRKTKQLKIVGFSGLVGLITQRSSVQVRSPLLKSRARAMISTFFITFQLNCFIRKADILIILALIENS